MKYFILFLLLSLCSIAKSQDVFPFTAKHGVTHELIDIYVNDLEGKKHFLKELMPKGKIYLVSVWATWCGPCKVELNALNKVYKEWIDKYNFEFIALSTDNAHDASKIMRMANQMKWDFPVLHDTLGYVSRELEIFSLPQSFLVDQNGNICYHSKGYRTGMINKIEAEIKSLSLN